MDFKVTEYNIFRRAVASFITKDFVPNLSSKSWSYIIF